MKTLLNYKRRDAGIGKKSSTVITFLKFSSAQQAKLEHAEGTRLLEAFKKWKKEKETSFFQPTKKPFVKQRMKLGLPFCTMRKERNSEFGTLDNVNSEESSENGGGKTEKLFLPFPALCDDSKLSKELSFARRADLAKEDEDDDEESQELSWREKSGGNGRRWDSKLMPSKNFESWKKRKKWERDWGFI